MPTPRQVTICPSSLPGASLGVFSTDWIKEGTEMGPFTGRAVPLQSVAKDMDNRFMWEVRLYNNCLFKLVKMCIIIVYTVKVCLEHVACEKCV